MPAPYLRDDNTTKKQQCQYLFSILTICNYIVTFGFFFVSYSHFFRMKMIKKIQINYIFVTI